MSEGIQVKEFACTWPQLTAKMQQEKPLEYAFCINYIRMEKLKGGFKAKSICKLNSKGTKITFRKIQDRVEHKQAAVGLIDEYYDLKEKLEDERKRADECLHGRV